VNDATTAVLRCTNRTLTSATGSLLLERLLAGAAYFTATLNVVGALTSSSKLANNNLVQQRNVCLNIKDVVRQFY
jgi:hypothetical protein